MFPQRLDSTVAYGIARAMMDGFNRHYRLFRAESARAKHRFETADWHGQQRAQRERIEFYDLRVNEAVARLRAELPADVPTLEQAIACFGELGLGCNVEIKPCEGRERETARVTVETLRRAWPAGLPPPLLSSFKDVSLAAARDVAPEFDRALLIDDLQDGWRSRTDAVGAVGVNTSGKRLTAPRAVEIRAAGFALSVYTINDGAVAKALVGMGVHCVITDAPDVILAALN